MPYTYELQILDTERSDGWRLYVHHDGQMVRHYTGEELKNQSDYIATLHEQIANLRGLLKAETKDKEAWVEEMSKANQALKEEMDDMRQHISTLQEQNDSYNKSLRGGILTGARERVSELEGSLSWEQNERRLAQEAANRLEDEVDKLAQLAGEQAVEILALRKRLILNGIAPDEPVSIEEADAFTRVRNATQGMENIDPSAVPFITALGKEPGKWRLE